MIPFCVIVVNVFGYRYPQMPLTQRYDAVKTLPAYSLYLIGRTFPHMRLDSDSWREDGGA